MIRSDQNLEVIQGFDQQAVMPGLQAEGGAHQARKERAEKQNVSSVMFNDFPCCYLKHSVKLSHETMAFP